MRYRFLQWIKDGKLKFLSVLPAISAAALDKGLERLAGGAQSLPNSCFRAMGARNQVRSLSLRASEKPGDQHGTAGGRYWILPKLRTGIFAKTDVLSGVAAGKRRRKKRTSIAPR